MKKNNVKRICVIKSIFVFFSMIFSQTVKIGSGWGSHKGDYCIIRKHRKDEVGLLRKKVCSDWRCGWPWKAIKVVFTQYLLYK